MSKRIVIVGGGYIGAELAKSLEEKADVTLIEPRSHFVHAPAMIRAVVDPALLDQALIPYDGLLKRGKIIREQAKVIDGTSVTLENGEKVFADYIVVATGSNNATPFKPDETGIAGLKADNARVNGMLNAANNVVIVGAGAVGVELAGEIAHAMPEKKITLVSDQQSLFPDMPAKLGQGLEAKLRGAGVELVFGARAENLESLTAPYAGTLKLSNGAEMTADLIFPAIGSRATSILLEDLPGAVKSSANRIKTDAWMRPSSSLPNVFAAGDVADAGDAMTIVAASRQLPWLKKTLMAVVAGKKVEDLAPYKPWAQGKAPILIPLGPKKGSSFLVLFIAGNLLTGMMKGKDLFISKYRKLLGQS